MTETKDQASGSEGLAAAKGDADPSSPPDAAPDAAPLEEEKEQATPLPPPALPWERYQRGWWYHGLLMLMALGAVVVFLEFLIRPRLGIDLWYDELYTLKNFVFEGPLTIALDYHVPNNHILYNQFLYYLLNFLGLGSLDKAAAEVWTLRAIMTGLTLWTGVACWRAARRFIGPEAGLVAVLFLLGTLPFAVFAVQLRGYGVSMALMAVLLQLLWTREQVGGHRRFFLALALVTAALLYILPSTLYILAPVGLYCALLALGQIRLRLGLVRGLRLALRSRVGGAGLALLFGLGLAILLYLPVLPQMLGDTPYIRGQGVGESLTWSTLVSHVLDRALPVWEQLTQTQIYVVLVAGVGLLLALFVPGIHRAGDWRRVFLLLLILIVPFVLSALRGDTPPSRVFLPLLPVLALLVALGIQRLLDLFGRGPLGLLRLPLLLALGAGMAFLVWQDQGRTLQRIETALAKGELTQDLTAVYYQHAYQPRALMQKVAEVVEETPQPVLHVDWVDYQATTIFGALADVTVINVKDQIRLPADMPEAILLVQGSAQRRQAVRAANPEAICRDLFPEAGLFAALSCRREEPSP